MKHQSTTLLLLSGLLALMSLPVAAQEKPMPPASHEEVKRPELLDTPNRLRKTRPPEEKSTTYLGVLTAQVSRELRAQFDLMEGFGLLIQEVMPDSPAKEAGLKEHDVLVSFEDQKLVNMEQLQTLVRSKKKEDAVLLTIISGGQTKQVTVKIGERMMAMTHENPSGFTSSFPDMRRGVWENTDQWRDVAEDIRRRTRDYQERLQDWNRNGSRGPMPKSPIFESPSRKDGEGDEVERRSRDGFPSRSGPPDHSPKGSKHRFEYFESHASANVTRSDDTGIYSLGRNDGNQVFTVKPKDGEEKSWPVNNDQERAAVPEPFASKLREMDQIRSHMRDEKGTAPDGDRRPDVSSERNDAASSAKRPEGL